VFPDIRAQLVIFCGYAAFAQIVAVRPNGNRRFCGPDAAAIRAAFNQEGELSTAIQLRRRSPGIADNARAREYARSIAWWTPMPFQPRLVTRIQSGETCALYIYDNNE
jgi:hypothetical protein